MAITRIKNNQITDSTITNVKIAGGTLTGDLMNSNLTFNSNLTLNGNLVVTGNVTAVQSTTTQITDPLLTLGLGNGGTSYDLGLILTRGSGGNRFLGWKESDGAFAFVNTTEDGATTGNIAVTAYGNAKIGNIAVLGASTLGSITVSENTVSAANTLTLRSDTGSIALSNATTISGATILSSTLSVVGAATVASLTSNAGIIGTTGSFSSNLAASALTVNNSATIGSTLGVTGNINGSGISLTGSLRATGPGDFDGGLQSTPIGNASASTGQFTTISATGNITGAAITSNGTATIGSTLGVTGNINGSGITLTGSLRATGPGDFDGGLQSTPIGNASASTGQFTTISATGNITAAALTSNGTATIGSTLGVTGNINGSSATLSGSATVGSTLGVTGNINGASATLTGSATIGTTLGVTGNATIGNVSTAAIGASGIVTITNATDATGASSGALQVTGGASINKNLYVTGNIYAGNIIAIQANTLSVQDPLLYLTANTPYPYNYSIGFHSQYIGGNPGNIAGNIYQHTGFVRDNTDLTWKLFSNVAAEPGITVDFTNAQYDAIRVGNTTVSGTLTVSGATTQTGNLTVNGLTVNTSSTFGTTLRAAGGIQNTPIGNASASTAQFTTVSATGNITAAALTSNGTATIGSTLGVTGNINGSSATLSGSATIGSTLGVTGNINGTSAALSGSATIGSTLGVTGNINGSGITLSGSLRATGPGDFDGGLQSTPIGNASASTGQFTTISATGNATVAGLTVNASAVIGTTLSAAGGIQGTPIGNVTISSGAFSSLTTNGATTIQGTGDSTSPTSGAITVAGGVGIAKALNVGTTATLGNVTFNNLTISSNITNQGLNINPNGTGTTTINSGLNASRTVINGTTNANTFVVSGTQVGIATNTFVSGATFQVNALDSMLIPSGATGDRPGSPTTGMLRFNTSSGTIEWWSGSSWGTPTGSFTVVVANTQTGNGSATVFTIPAANATTAGTIVSINGVVQQPVTAYSVTGANVTFTEAPSSTDVIDFRVFTTTSQVIEVTDAFGNTGLFFDQPTAGSAITTFKTSGVESFSIQANSQARFSGNVVPSANLTYSLGSSTNRWKDAWIGGTTLYLGNIAIKETAANTIGFFALNGITPATITSDISDPSGIQGTPIGNATPSSGAFTTLSATGVSNFNGNVNTNNIMPFGNANANIGSTALQFNTIFAKATSAQYADLAENYAADQVYEPGTVVHFGGVEEITKCNEDMCQRVAGVVSTNPAYIMNSGQTGIATAIALQGRVPTKVRGSIRKGDMMVSAGAGYARAEANPKIGSVIGKALADFDGLEGVIEVVVGRL